MINGSLNTQASLTVHRQNAGFAHKRLAKECHCELLKHRVLLFMVFPHQYSSQQTYPCIIHQADCHAVTKQLTCYCTSPQMGWISTQQSEKGWWQEGRQQWRGWACCTWHGCGLWLGRAHIGPRRAHGHLPLHDLCCRVEILCHSLPSVPCRSSTTWVHCWNDNKDDTTSQPQSRAQHWDQFVANVTNMVALATKTSL